MSNPLRSRHAGKLALLVVLIVVLAFALYGTARWLHFRWTHVVTDDARIEGEVITISSRVPGWITALPVIEGDVVKAGAPLVNIDDRQTRLSRDALNAQLAANAQRRDAQQAELHQLDASTAGALDNARGKFDAAGASRQSAEARVAQLEAEYRRSEDLAARKFVSPQALETARTNLTAARADLRRTDGELAASRGALRTAGGDRDKLATLRAQIQASLADAEQIKAQISALDSDLEDRAMKAPFDATVVTTFTHAREYVVAGQRLLMLHDPKQHWVSANVKETEIADVKVGEAVEVRASAYPDTVFRGRVARVGGAATSKFALLPDPNPSGNFTRITQRIPVRIELDDANTLLHPGMMVEVAIEHARS